MEAARIRRVVAIAASAVMLVSLTVSAAPPGDGPDKPAKSEAKVAAKAERNAERQARAEARAEARAAKKAQKAEARAAKKVAKAERKQAKQRPEKVTLCHKPGTPAEQTITVGAPAVKAHVAHGDELGECSDVPPGWCKPALEILVPDEHPWAQELLLGSSLTCEDTTLQVPALAWAWEIEGVVMDPATRETHSLYIPADKPDGLAIGVDHVVTLTVDYGPPVGGSTEASDTFRLIHSPLVAIIDGGSRSVYVGAPHTLDASPSYDPDAPLGGELAFHWTLTDAAGDPVPGAPAFDELPVLGFDSLTWLQPGQDYLVTVTVTDELTDREASQTITLTAIDAATPVVSISTTTPVINADERLRLQGAVSGLTSSDVTYRWSEETGKLSYGDLTDPLNIASRPDTVLLIIRENVLTPGETYVLRLTVTDVLSGGVGFAEVTIGVNEPTGG